MIQNQNIVNVSQLKISEIARITGVSVPLISRQFKNHDEDNVTRVNNRIIGVSSTAVENYFKEIGLDYLYRGAVINTANLCGGVGKTSSIKNLAAACSRIVSKDTAIVLVDSDPQGSFTASYYGEPADDNELILIDFLEKKASIDDVLTHVKDNVWFVKSNLNQAYIERILSKPGDIKNKMLNFYESIFDKLGPQTKIFQDYTPYLSNLFASTVCALHQLPSSIVRSILVPIRPDKFAVQGAEKIIKEMKEIREAYSFPNPIDIHCFFSNVDRRIPTTAEAFQLASKKESILEHLSSVAVRFNGEIARCNMHNTNVFNSGKYSNATEDYQDLLQYIFSYHNKD
jgi:cellulose biosynthesis protein BcsQ